MLQMLFGDYPLQFIGLPLIAGFVCFWSWAMAVAMIQQAQNLDGRRRAIWTAISALVAGNGLWATHYIVVIALYSGEHAWYEIGNLFDSAALIFACASAACYFLVYKDSFAARLIAGLALGVAIAVTPFMGLQGVSANATAAWNANVVVASLTLSVALSIGAVAAIRTGKRTAAGISSLSLLVAAVAGAHLLALSGAAPGLGALSTADAGPENFNFIARAIGFLGALVLAGVAAAALFDRYQLERDRYAETLEAMLAQVKLSEQQAKAANKAKADFLANMNHEIRTPMNGVLGMLEVLKTSSLPPEQRQQAALAFESAEHLHQILQDVINLTLLDNGGVFIDDRPFDLRAILDHVEKRLAPKCALKNLHLSVKAAPDFPPLVSGDGERVRQIISHLADNAVKFTQSGSVSIFASIADAAGGRSQVNIAVNDTGVGMSPAAAARLFEAFAQGDTPSKSRAGGLGLGLAICSKIAARMGGGLTVDSAPGAGSTFNLWFAVGAVAPNGGEIAATIARPLTILVVDDNHANLCLMSALLSGEGHHCDFATDGFEAVRRFTLERYDLILMDVQMPEMDGFTAAARIRAMEKDGARTPILAVSAGDEHVDRERCRAAGMDGYVSKPVRPASLNRAIASALSARPAPRRPEAGPPLAPAAPIAPASADARRQPLAALDERVLDSLRTTFGADGFQTALERTLDEATDIVAKIRFALHARDYAAARTLAHGLKGMASNWGAPLLADRARRLEEIADEQTDLCDPVDELDRQISAARRALDAYLTFDGAAAQRSYA